LFRLTVRYCHAIANAVTLLAMRSQLKFEVVYKNETFAVRVGATLCLTKQIFFQTAFISKHNQTKAKRFLVDILLLFQSSFTS